MSQAYPGASSAFKALRAAPRLRANLQTSRSFSRTSKRAAVHPTSNLIAPKQASPILRAYAGYSVTSSRRSLSAASRSLQQRYFSASPRSEYKTVEEAKSRHRSGVSSEPSPELPGKEPAATEAPISEPPSGGPPPYSGAWWFRRLFESAVFLLAAAGLTVYFQYEKARMERKRIAEANKGIGKPKVGGPFSLTDTDGKKFTSESLKGKYALVYFGFTHCPDICPEELDKMADMIDLVKEKVGNVMRPVFITCDPARDSPQVIKDYLKEFHEDLIGLTGSYDAIKNVCKVYRVYFSTPEHVKSGEDYLVDHSIYFYLMDPDGDFVEAIGRHLDPDQATKIIIDHMKDWKGPIDKY